MEMIPVESSNVREIGYDADTQTLGIIFNRGMLYHYFEVPQEVFDGLQEAPSIGKYFNSEVRNRYNFENKGSA